MGVATTTCYRHPAEETGLACSACERPICGTCAVQAPVGQRCPECAATQRQRTLRPRSLAHVPPVVSYAIAVAIVLVYVGPQHGLAAHGPTFGWGAASDAAIRDGEPWRVVTTCFMHVSVLHLGLNLWGLLVYGPRLEARFGPLRFGLLYLVAGVAGAAGGLLVNGGDVGASGALFGVVAAMWTVERANGAAIMGGMSAYVATCLVWTLAMASQAGVAVFGAPVSVGGHAGGFAAGLALGWAIERSPRGRTGSGLLDAGSALALATVLAVAVGGVALAAYGGVQWPALARVTPG